MQPPIVRMLVGTLEEIAFDTQNGVYMAVNAECGIERVYAKMLSVRASWLMIRHRAENLIGRELRFSFSQGDYCESFEVLESMTVPVLAYAS